jgi:DNA invertase Pin-like site-specific DNA recombinase
MPTIAYSYARCSSKKQTRGDSIRRQTDPERAEAYSRRRGWTLSEKTFEDLGVSAWKGKNALVGNLGEFLKAVESGAIKKGSALIVESLDRISRQGIDEGYDLIKRILKAGILLVTLTPEREFDVSATKSLSKGALEIQLILERAAEESERKSERIRAAWYGKKLKAKEGKTIVAGCLPAWIELRNGTLQLNPEKTKAVRRIFALAAAGYGRHRIAQALELEGFGEWSNSSIGFILTDKRALGFYQPKKLIDGDNNNRVADGEPLPNYYPAAVTENEWLAARAGMTTRRRTLGGGLQRKWTSEEDDVVRDLSLSVGVIARKLNRTRAAVHQRRHHLGLTTKQNREEKGNFVNIFSGLIRNARPPHDSYIVASRMNADGPAKALLNAAHAEGRAKCYLFPLEPFERAVLSFFREIKPSEILPAKDAAEPDPVTEIQTALAGIDAELKEATAFMDANGFSATIGKRIANLENRREELKAKLQDVQTRAAHPASAAWKEYGNLLDALEKAKDPKDARLRLRAALHRIVEHIRLLVMPVQGTCERLALVQIHFKDSLHVRLYALLHRPHISNKYCHKPDRTWSIALDVAAASPLQELPTEDVQHMAKTVRELAEAKARGDTIDVVEG